MSVLTDAVRGDVERSPDGQDGPPRHPARRRRAVALLLAAVSLACVALLAWMALDGSDSADGGLSLPDEREQVMGLTSQFVKRLGTYSPDMLDDSGQMPAYREQVREVITPKFAADFDQEVATAEQLVAQGGITRSADVFATAVSAIDDDSARVLVAGAFTDSYEQGAGDKAGKKGEKPRVVDQEPLPFRFTVDLVMIKGEWLVDDFSPVSSADDGGSGTGSDGASDGASDGSEGSTP